MVKKKEKKLHNAHVLIPEDVWQKLVKAADAQKTSVTQLLIEGATHILDNCPYR